MKPRAFLTAVVTSVYCAAAAAAGGASSVPVYDATQVAPGSFVVVERIGVQGWRSAFGVPAYSTEDAARDAVLARAAQLGADGVVNLTCMSKSDRMFNPVGYFCYANAMKARNDLASLGNAR